MELVLIPEPKKVVMRSGARVRPELLRGARVRNAVDPSLGRELGEEGYLLSISKDGARISAATKRGIFYGKATLQQVVEQARGNTIPPLEIRDWPDVPVRGFHFDFRVQRPKVAYKKRFLVRQP